MSSMGGWKFFEPADEAWREASELETPALVGSPLSSTSFLKSA